MPAPTRIVIAAIWAATFAVGCDSAEAPAEHGGLYAVAIAKRTGDTVELRRGWATAARAPIISNVAVFPEVAPGRYEVWGCSAGACRLHARAVPVRADLVTFLPPFGIEESGVMVDSSGDLRRSFDLRRLASVDLRLHFDEYTLLYESTGCWQFPVECKRRLTPRVAVGVDSFYAHGSVVSDTTIRLHRIPAGPNGVGAFYEPGNEPGAIRYFYSRFTAQVNIEGDTAITALMLPTPVPHG